MESVFGLTGYSIATFNAWNPSQREIEFQKALSEDYHKFVELVNVRQLAKEFNCTTKEVMKTVRKHNRVLKKHGLWYYSPAITRHRMKYRDSL